MNVLMWEGSAKVNTVLTRECTGHSKHLIPTQETTLYMNITRWSIQKSDWLYSLNWRWRSSIQLAETRPRADCGSDHELLIAKSRIKLKKVGKNTRPFEYDLDKIPYDYTVLVTNRFKGLVLVDRMPEEWWVGVCNTVQEEVTKTIPKRKKCKKAKELSEGVLQIGEKRGEAKSKGERERYTQLNAEFQGIERKNKKAFLSENFKEIDKNSRMGKTRDLFKKIRDSNGIFHAKIGSIKDRNSKDLTEAGEIKKRWQEYTE